MSVVLEKETKVRNIRDILSQETQARLDKKQIKAVRWMLKHAEKMTNKKYCRLNRCSDETARKDFNLLLKTGLVERIGRGRTTGYVLKAE